MFSHPTTIEIDPESELGRALDTAAGPLFLIHKGKRYRVLPEEEDITAGYEPDPERVWAMLAATAGSWADLDIDQVIRDLYAARWAGSRPPERL